MFYWVGMQKSVVDYIAQCDRCIRRKDYHSLHAPLVNTRTTQPMELVCIDFLKPGPSKGGIENVLVVTDHFTKYAQAYPTRNQTASTTKCCLTNSLCIMVSHISYIVTRVGILKVKPCSSFTI